MNNSPAAMSAAIPIALPPITSANDVLRLPWPATCSAVWGVADLLVTVSAAKITGVISFVGRGVAVSNWLLVTATTAKVGVSVGGWMGDSSVGVGVAVAGGGAVTRSGIPVGVATCAPGSGVRVGVRSGPAAPPLLVGVANGETTGVSVKRRVAVGAGRVAVGNAVAFATAERVQVGVDEGATEMVEVAVGVGVGVSVGTPTPADTGPKSAVLELDTSRSR